MLSSVLILASTAKSPIIGIILMVIYTLGFIIPFLILGLFTTKILEFLNRKKNLLKYTIKVGGVILIIMGIMTFTGWMNSISGYLNSVTNDLIGRVEDNSLEDSYDDENGGNEEPQGAIDEPIEEEKSKENPTEEEQVEEEPIVVPAIDFTLTDQYGNEHTLSDYKGKVVFLNFWATWCPPCREEMPDIEKLYQELGLNEMEVAFLGVSQPRTDSNSNTREVSKEEVIEFLEENEYTFPTVFDETGELYSSYYIQALPTTFLIDKEGNINGYYPGSMSENIMRTIIEDTIKVTE